MIYLHDVAIKIKINYLVRVIRWCLVTSKDYINCPVFDFRWLNNYIPIVV